MSTLRTNNLQNPDSSNVNIELTQGGGAVIAGVTTFSSNVKVNGNLNVDGIVTYEDVTNVDAIGIGTFRAGINVSGGDITIPDSIIHLGDTNTKIRFPADDTFTVETGGSERLRITSAGLIGVGTNDPDAFSPSADDLVLRTTGDTGITIRSGTSNSGNIYFARADNAASNSGIISYLQNTYEMRFQNYGGGNEFFTFYAQGNERLRIAADGKIGIGDATPENTLTIKNIGSFDGDANSFYLGSNFTGTGQNFTGTGKHAQRFFFNNASSNGYLKYENTGTTGNAGDTITWQERFRIASNGNFGIGTANPQLKLVVSNNGALGFEVDPSQSSGTVCGVNAYDRNASAFKPLRLNAEEHRFDTSSTERLRIDSSGRVLQGLTSAKFGFFNDVNAPPVFQIQGSTYYDSALSIFRDGTGGSGPNFILAKGRGAIVQDNDILGTISFQGHDGTTELIEGASIVTEVDGTPSANNVPSALVFKTNSGTSSTSERLRITGAGDMGLGTASPVAKLDVRGNVYVGSSIGVDISNPQEYHASANDIVVNNGMTIANTSQGSIFFADSSTGTGEYVGQINYIHGSDYMNFVVNNGDRMRIDSAGGLYIGNPGNYGQSNYGQSSGDGNFYYRKDDGSSGGAIILATDSDRGWANMYLNRTDWSSGKDTRFISFMKNGNTLSSIDIGANQTSVAYNTGSDYRLKENVVPMTDGIARVKQLQPKQFNMIGDPNKMLCDGFIAHEAQTVVPLSVSGTHNAMKTDEHGNEIPDYQGMDYGKITPLLTAALQEAITKIETLETKVAALEGS